MVARTRLGRICQGLALHIVAALIIGYFAFQGYHGNYGLLAQRQFEQDVVDLTLERDTLRAARSQWEYAVAATGFLVFGGLLALARAIIASRPIASMSILKSIEHDAAVRAARMRARQPGDGERGMVERSRAA